MKTSKVSFLSFHGRLIFLVIIIFIAFLGCEGPATSMPNDPGNQNPPGNTDGILTITNLSAGDNYYIGVYNHSGEINNFQEWGTVNTKIVAAGVGMVSASTTLNHASRFSIRP